MAKALLLLSCLFSASILVAQQTSASDTGTPSPQAPASSAPSLTGQVTGRVICGDTDAPGRFASVQLIPEKPEAFNVSALAAFGKSPDFAKALNTMMGALTKGSNLSVLTGLDGTFALDKVPAGTYYAVATLSGYESPLNQFSQAERLKAEDATLKAIEGASPKLVVQPNVAGHVELRLERGASLSGRIRYDDGSPAPGVTPILMLQQKDGTWKELTPSASPQMTDDRGQFRFSGLPTGKFAVKAALPTSQASLGIGTGSLAMHLNTGDALIVYSGGATRAKEIKPIEVGTGDDVDGIELVFPLSGLHTLVGSVLVKQDGHAVNSGTVVLLDSDTKAAVRTAMLDAEGKFRLNYILDGQYALKVSGAADIEAPAEISDLGRLLGAKPLKTYADVEVPVVVKSDLPALILQVSEPPKTASTNSSN